ncbi:MAG: hypothetical protein WAT39_17415 [Planctomycetota bacterium]
MTTGTGRAEGPRGQRGECATVLAALTNAMFRLQLGDGREVVAHAAADLRMAFTRLLPGDRVLVEVSPFDPGKARICKRLDRTHDQHEQPRSQPTAISQTAISQPREPS